jgi:hypothetical protein
MQRVSRNVGVVAVLLGLAATGCGGGSGGAKTAAKDAAATPTSASGVAAASGGSASKNGCGVTLADVQKVLPANAPVQQNTTPDPDRCNFTWQSNGNWGIDALTKRGGRQQIESSPQAPAGPATLGSGKPYQAISGLGDKAWASGDAHQAGVVALKGNDVVVVGITYDKSAAAGSQPATGLNQDWVAICKALAQKALS